MTDSVKRAGSRVQTRDTTAAAAPAAMLLPSCASDRASAPVAASASLAWAMAMLRFFDHRHKCGTTQPGSAWPSALTHTPLCR